MDAAVTSGVIVRIGGESSPVSTRAPAGLLLALSRGGIPEASLAVTGIGLPHLDLPAEGWESLNLGALVAAARARPGTAIRASAGVALVPTDHANSDRQIRFFPPRSPRPRVALLDRDGTIIEDRHYLADPDGVVLLPGAAAGLARLSALGVPLIVLTNQSGVASGRLTLAEVEAVNQRMTALLAAVGVVLAGIEVCPHAEQEHCDCRKPATGLARRAAAALSLDLREAFVVGDKASDIGLARTLGVPAFLVTTGRGAEAMAVGRVDADYLVGGLDEVASLLAHPAGLGDFRDHPA